MIRLFLVRHGRTEWNNDRRYAGRSDIDLTAEGREQAAKLRDRLRSEKFDGAFSSSLKRAVNTAEIICEPHGLEIEPCPELSECYYGDAEGLTYPQIKEKYPEVAKQIYNGDAALCFPNGECFRDFQDRVATFIDRFEDTRDHKDYLVVVHGGVLRSLLCALLELQDKHWWKFRFGNASLSIVEIWRNGVQVNVLNDTSHLNGDNRDQGDN